jgi:hypothetical protein
LFRDKDGRIFYHHDLWECWKQGLYRNGRKDESKVKQSLIILNSIENCGQSFQRVILDWHYSSQVHLSNKSINRQAWIGQASCCLNHGSNEDETKIAWNQLSTEEQNRANQIADYYIRKFEIEVMKDEEIIRNKCSRRCERTYNMDI